MRRASEHPRFRKFFKMLGMRIPMQVDDTETTSHMFAICFSSTDHHTDDNSSIFLTVFLNRHVSKRCSLSCPMKTRPSWKDQTSSSRFFLEKKRSNKEHSVIYRKEGKKLFFLKRICFFMIGFTEVKFLIMLVCT
jgi:hypothetical protein